MPAKSHALIDRALTCVEDSVRNRPNDGDAMATRDLLQQRLSQFERLLPDLEHKHPCRDHLTGESHGHADRITNDTSAVDYECANEALDTLLTRFGIPPQKDELPADG